MGKVLAITNRKGGTAKTMTSVSLGAALVRQGKSVLIIDADSQHSATVSLGVAEPDKLEVTLATVMQNIIGEQEIDTTKGIISHTRVFRSCPQTMGLRGWRLSLHQS